MARVSRNPSLSAEQTPVQTRPPGKVRNLALQPEAFRMSHRLGKRFTPSPESAAYVVATLITEGVEQSVSITRRQTSTGEDVAMAATEGAGTLNWNETDGATAIGANLNKAQQILIERVACDSPDQFVLAQLRGARYYTVARNVRADAGGAENYSGPLWDVVRVDEPQTESARRALSKYRLYYINVQTGLLDKIVSDLEGETIEAHILSWSDQLGDKFPSHIVWKRGNETVQEYRLLSVSLQSRL